MKFLLLSFAFLFSFLAVGESASGFPAKEVGFQALNFFTFFAVFIFLLKKPVKEFFKKRREDFFLFEKQAKEHQEKSLKELKDWELKVKDLESKTGLVKEDAKKEGDRFKEQKKKEIEDLKERLQKEKSFFLNLESQKMKKDSLVFWKKKITEEAEATLEKESLDPSLKSKLHERFLKQIEVGK